MGRQIKDDNYQEIIIKQSTREIVGRHCNPEPPGRNLVWAVASHAGQTETLQPELASSQYTKSIQVRLGNALIQFPN